MPEAPPTCGRVEQGRCRCWERLEWSDFFIIKLAELVDMTHETSRHEADVRMSSARAVALFGHLRCVTSGSATSLL